MKIPAFLLTLFLISLTSAPTRADFNATPTLQAQSLNYAQPLASNVNQDLYSGRISIPGSIRFSDQVKFRFLPLAQTDPANKSVNEQFYADLPEAYLEWKSGYYSIQLGQNVFNWEGTDGFNPVDVVNARREFDPIHAEKLGALSLSVRGGSDIVDWQLLYIPTQAKTQLPGENSRWLPRQIYVPDAAGEEILLPSVVNYIYEGGVEMDDALENNYGGRLCFHLSGLDLAFMNFEGSALLPAIVPTVSGQITEVSPTLVIQANPDIGLQPFFYRHRTTGTTAVVTLGDTLFRVAADYDQPLSSGLDVPGWGYNTVIGLEHTFPVGQGTLTFIPQYGYGQHEDQAGDEITSSLRIFDKALMGGFRYAPSETWTITPSYLYDCIFGDQFASLEVLHNFSDHFKADLTGELFWGTPGSVLGSYSQNDRILLDLIFSTDI